MPKIRIKRSPQAKSMPKSTGNQAPPVDKTAHPYPGRFHGGNTPEIKINETLQPTSREHATLEAEKGETVVTNLQQEGIPEFYKIAGKPHSKGGTPLNLPENSFIFSKDRKLAIKDPEILKLFNKVMKKGSKKGFTPADISKQYNLNKYREILANPFTDHLQRETAEKMIQNYVLKLGKLSLLQESMKGFEGDLPAIAQGYLQHVSIDPTALVASEGQETPQAAPQPQMPAARYGLEAFKNGGLTKNKKRKVCVKKLPMFIGGGSPEFDEKTGQYMNQTLPGIADLQQETGQKINTDNQNDYMETQLKQSRDWGQIARKMTGPLMSKIAAVGRNMTEPKINMEDFTHADQVFTSSAIPDYGSNMFNTQGVVDPYRVKEAPQFTGQYAGRAMRGGEYKFGGAFPGYDVNGLPIMQEGGSIETSNQPTKRQNIPQDGVFWDPDSDGYDASKVKANHYIKKDGRWFKITGYQKPEFTGDPESLDKRLGTFSTDYALLKEKFTDPDLRKAFYEQYQTEMKKAKPNRRTGLSQTDIDNALNMTEEQVIDNFLKKEAINLAINAKHGDLSEYDKKDLWDKNPNLANNMAKELGFEPLSKSEVASFQGAYIGVNNLSKDGKHDKMFKDFMVTQVGRPDEQVAGVEAGSISQIDGWDGNTTSAEVMLPRESEMKLQELEDLEEQNEEVQKSASQQMLQPQAAQYTPFWTQDLNNLGLALDQLYGIEKAKPWNAPLQYREATPAVQDFRGTAARIGSAASAGANQAATFAGPQGYAATFANIQKGAVDPILKAQEAERMGNQDVINKFELFNTQGFNQFARAKQALDTNLYDKHVIANQQFKNAKNQAKAQTVAMINRALTNRGMTQNMNLMTDEYYIDPVTGFKQYKNVNIPMQPSTSQGDSLYSNYQKIMTENPGIDSESARKLAKDMAGIPEFDQYPQGVNPAAYMYPGRQA